MQQYNFPTTILCGCNSLDQFVTDLKEKSHQKALVVTDKTIETIGLLSKLTNLLEAHHIPYVVFSDTHPNPTQDDVENGTRIYLENNCDYIIALGGGSPIDTAKTIKIMATHPEPLAQYDDAKGGDSLITNPMPPLYAIPTTAGTGSEVGRSSVIIMRDTGKKTIFFHPSLMPDTAVLEPLLTTGLPTSITASTGMDAFIHCLEAYFSLGLHPMADGIAYEGLKQVIDWLPVACAEPENLNARERMLIAAAMGATAFQKGLGMIHSMAHPLSSRHDLHHGLASAIILPFGIAFLENSQLNDDQKRRISDIRSLFKEKGEEGEILSENCASFIKKLGITVGLRNYDIQKDDLKPLSEDSFKDPCHATNMIPVTKDDFLNVLEAAF